MEQGATTPFTAGQPRRAKVLIQIQIHIQIQILIQLQVQIQIQIQVQVQVQIQIQIQVLIQIQIQIQIQISRGSVWSISSPSAQSGPRRYPEGRFQVFPTPARKVVPGSIQRVVLEHFKPQRAKWSQEASRGSFSSISNASSQSGPRKHPEGSFGAFQAPARKVVPGELRRAQQM